jgi:hypothetical protein
MQATSLFNRPSFLRGSNTKPDALRTTFRLFAPRPWSLPELHLVVSCRIPDEPPSLIFSLTPTSAPSHSDPRFSASICDIFNQTSFCRCARLVCPGFQQQRARQLLTSCAAVPSTTPRATDSSRLLPFPACTVATAQFGQHSITVVALPRLATSGPQWLRTARFLFTTITGS